MNQAPLWEVSIYNSLGGAPASYYVDAGSADITRGFAGAMTVSDFKSFLEPSMPNLFVVYCRAGVSTELHIYPGAPHAFMFVPDAHVTRAFARDSMTALSRALGAASAG